MSVTGICGKTVVDVVESTEYTEDTEIIVTPGDLGISNQSIVVGARVFLEVTANDTANATFYYYGPVILDADGSDITSSSGETNILTISAGSTNNVTGPVEDTNEAMNPLSGNGGMRFYLDGTWSSDSVTFAMHMAVLYVN